MHSFTAYLLRRIPQFSLEGRASQNGLHPATFLERGNAPLAVRSHMFRPGGLIRGYRRSSKRRPLARHQHKITATHINSNIPERMQEETKISLT